MELHLISGAGVYFDVYGGDMKTFIRTAGIFILALFLGIILAPRAHIMANLTGGAFKEQVHAIAIQVQGLVDASSPSVAFHLATILLAAGAVVVIFFIYLLVFVPIRIYSMQREIRSQGEQIQSMKSEIHLSNELLLEARAKYQAPPKIERGIEMDENASKSRLHQFIFSDRSEQQTKIEGPQT